MISNIQPNNSFWHSKIFYFLVIFLITDVFLFFFTPQIRSFLTKYDLGQKILELPEQSKKTSLSTGIVQIGQEIIYQETMEEEAKKIAFMRKEATQAALAKIITDSIILQGAQADNLIDLDPTVFNAKKLNFERRTDLVDKVKKMINDQADVLEGSIIGVWFYNLGAGKAGYEKGKEIAYQKISQLHTEVKVKKITIQQAGEILKNDSSLTQLDKDYKNHSLMKFRVQKGEPPSGDNEFDSVLWKLNEGETSEIYLIKGFEIDKDLGFTDKKIDVAYFFGQISKKEIRGRVGNFNEWLTQKRKQYEVTYQ